MGLKHAIGVELKRMLKAVHEVERISNREDEEWTSSESKSFRYSCYYLLDKYVVRNNDDWEIDEGKVMISEKLASSIKTDPKKYKALCIEYGKKQIKEVMEIFEADYDHFLGDFDSNDEGYPRTPYSFKLRYDLDYKDSLIVINSIKEAKYNSDGVLAYNEVDLN